MWIYSKLLNHILKNGKDDAFYVMCFLKKSQQKSHEIFWTVKILPLTNYDELSDDTVSLFSKDSLLCTVVSFFQSAQDPNGRRPLHSLSFGRWKCQYDESMTTQIFSYWLKKILVATYMGKILNHTSPLL